MTDDERYFCILWLSHLHVLLRRLFLAAAVRYCLFTAAARLSCYSTCFAVSTTALMFRFGLFSFLFSFMMCNLPQVLFLTLSDSFLSAAAAIMIFQGFFWLCSRCPAVSFYSEKQLLFFTGFFVAAAAMLSHIPSFLCTVTFKAVSNPMLPLCSSCHCVSYSMFTVYSSCCVQQLLLVHVSSVQ
jgi:hypothetical protein